MVDRASRCFAIDHETKNLWRITAETGAVGLEIAAAIAIGYYGGQYLDGKLGTEPWMKWIGFGAGIGASVKALARVVRRYKKSLEDDT